MSDVKRHKILFESWKKPGIQLYRRVTETDHEGIRIKEERKSIGISRTFDAIYNTNEINRRMMVMARHIIYMVMAIEANPTSYYLKIGYEYGVKVKKTLTVDRIFYETLFKAMFAQMYEAISLTKKGAVKLTLSVSNFSSLKLKTLSLIEFNDDSKEKQLHQNTHDLRTRFGLDIIKTANEL